jgi:excisionase family DNA binding protein
LLYVDILTYALIVKVHHIRKLLGPGAMSEADELLTIEQAASFLKVSEASLRRWTNSGQLACLRVGRRRERRFRRADLLAFMEEQPAGRAIGQGNNRSSPTRHTSIGGLEVAYGTHLCGLYGSDAGRGILATAFLADGLGPGSVCYLVTEPGTRKAILGRLTGIRPSLREDVDAGRLVVSEYAASARAQWEYFEDQFLGATGAGAHSLRVVGDLRGLCKALSPRGLVEYEAGYQERLAQRFPVVTLCQYDVRVFSGLQILDALAGHADTFRYPPERVLA